MLCKKPVGCRKLSGTQGEVLKWKKIKIKGCIQEETDQHIILISVRSEPISSICRYTKNLEYLLYISCCRFHLQK